MPFPGARRRRKRIGHKAGRCPRTLFTLGTLLQFSELVMAGEIVYADLRRPGDGFSPAQKCRAPALCPWWHGVLLKVGGLGHLVLLVLVVVLSVQVFQGSLWRTGTNAPWQDGGETQGRNHTERCVISALMRYFCQPRCKSPAGLAAPRGQMLPAFQGKGELESRQERLQKSGVSLGSAPGQERKGVHQECNGRRHAAGVDWIALVPLEVEMGGQHPLQHQYVHHPAGDE
ncbi:uncharacterized protein LOC116960911 isoform X6 [Tyto alba]|uniref:uncharacterized protein LOC116960911 isoform X6 n=1 Tax=Tyto alba TaxID=56313 RepID=UPI001C680E3B|nr:uncharacterized protein LOC116960911 isoform X6 [Tyto alba]